VAFQWYVGTKYITDLRTGYMMGCMVVREDALDALSAEQQAVVHKAAAKAGLTIDGETRRQNEKLLGGIFQKQGLKLVPVSAQLRKEFFAAAQAARERLGAALVPPALLEQVVALLEDFRAHAQRAGH
jgi:TRAP-type C4-dicarboxylate transport system substrate-binding protein